MPQLANLYSGDRFGGAWATSAESAICVLGTTQNAAPERRADNGNWQRRHVGNARLLGLSSVAEAVRAHSLSELPP